MDAVHILPLAMPTATNESTKFKGLLKSLFGNGAEANAIGETEQNDSLTDGMSVSMLLGSGKKTARNRMQIYYK